MLGLPDSARARSLLAWLAVHRGLHSRTRLAGLLRPEATEESARKTVRDAVWAIRQALDGRSQEALVTERDRLGLAPGAVTDLDEARAALRAGRLDEAVGLAAGELLPGMHDDWVVAARGELAGELDDALERLASNAESRGDLAAAVRYSRRRAALDGLAEQPVRELIRRLAAAGDRGRALSVYEEFAARLRRDLQTVPSAETRQLVAAVRRGEVAQSAPRVVHSDDRRAAGPAEVVVPPAAPAREVRYADSAGVNIAYTVVGEGPVDLVFVPGFVSHLEVLWEEPLAAQFLERLASFARVVLWDKREQGLSDRPGGAPTLEQSKQDLLAVMNAAGVGRTSIFGVSEGGPMSLLFAASHPERVDRLVLYGTHARVLKDHGYPEGLAPAAVERTLDELLSGWGGAPGLDVWAPSRIDDPRFVAWWSRLLRSGTSPGAVRAIMELNFEIDVRDVLPAVHAPTLVVHARDDRLVPARLGSYLAAHLADARLALVPGQDHIPFNAHAGELLDEVEEFLTGQRPEPRPDRILATVLFTDVVGSTERAARLDDRVWRAELDAYHAIVEHQLARFGGRRISSAGDGTLASFDGPARAVRCAQRIVDDARTHDIGVRAGLHTGECEIVGDDLAGVAVHIGARIGALAGPGEVLVSSTVRDLVVGSDLGFADRGERDLRGLPGRWRLLAAQP